jgi:hypothetical protein
VVRARSVSWHAQFGHGLLDWQSRPGNQFESFSAWDSNWAALAARINPESGAHKFIRQNDMLNPFHLALQQ